MDFYGLAESVVKVHRRLIGVDSRVGDQNVTSVCKLLIADLDSCVENAHSADISERVASPEPNDIVDMNSDGRFFG